MAILNKAQVDELFKREAVLLGQADSVPEFRAVALFGENAVAFASHLGGGAYTNGYGVGDYTLKYLTYRGVLAAASFCNVQQLRKECGAEGVTENG